MQIQNVYSKMQSLSSNSASHKSVILDLPLTFNSAIKPIQNTNTGSIVMSYTNRPHAATVGQESKVYSAGILNTTHRQRGGSEPTIPTAVVERPKKKFIEVPKPIVDREL
jgi:hypothetical protein